MGVLQFNCFSSETPEKKPYTFRFSDDILESPRNLCEYALRLYLKNLEQRQKLKREFHRELQRKRYIVLTLFRILGYCESESLYKDHIETNREFIKSICQKFLTDIVSVLGKGYLELKLLPPRLLALGAAY